MIKNIMAAAMLLSSSIAYAQTDSPFYLPGDGMYIVGIPSDMTPVVTEPTIMTQAYKAKFKVQNVDVISVRANEQSYDVSSYLNEERTELNLVPFLGVGEMYGLTARCIATRASYQLGDNSANKTWNTTRFLAAYPSWKGRLTYPLGVYDHWDCAVTYAPDENLTNTDTSVEVDFGNPYEGLVAKNINFTLVSMKSENPIDCEIEVTLAIDEEVSNGNMPYCYSIKSENVHKIKQDENGYNYYNVVVNFGSNIIINSHFTVSINGLSANACWLPRTIDTKGLYPTHTTYIAGNEKKAVAESDACVNVEGYFNYIGTWGWWDGKFERGECVDSEDYVQVYYDPADEDWPGDYFMGEATFPVECTFGAADIKIAEYPEWIKAIGIDDSQWEEYGALQLIIQADALPTDITGRNGKVVFSTSDDASLYTIYIRQGAAWFDFSDGISAPVISIPVKGGTFDLSGRSVKASNRYNPYIYIKDGRKYLAK